MGDESLSLPNPLPDIGQMSAPDQATVQSGLTEVDQIVKDCVQVVADIEDIIHNDVSSCLNSCQGDVGLCHACILGDIARYVEQAGNGMTGCTQKVLQSINAAMVDAWKSAAALGIPPPTQEQWAAALAGEVIPDADPTATVFTGSGGVTVDNNTGTISVDNGNTGPTVNLGGVQVPTVIGNVVGVNDGGVTLTPGVNAPQPTAVIQCVPSTWTPQDLLNWLAQTYGQNVQVLTLPTNTSGGAAVINGTLAPLPSLCALPPPPPPPTTQPTPITRPTPPPQTTPPTGSGSGGPIPPGANPLPGGQISVPAGTPFAPPGPIVMPDGTTCQCPVAYGSGHRVLPVDQRVQSDGSVDCYVRDWLGTDPDGNDVYGDWQLYNSVCATPPDTTPPDTTPPPPPPPPPKNPIHFGQGDVCSPDAILGAASRLDGFLKDPGTGTTDAAEALGGISGAIIAGLASNLAGIDAGKWSPLISLGGLIAGVENAEFIRQIIEPPVPPGDCHSPAFFLTAFARIFPNLFGGWFGAVPEQTQRQWDYSLNYICQNLIPSQPELNNLVNRGYIRTDSWEVGTKMLGNCVPWQESVRQLGHTRIGIADAYRLFKLGKITEDEFTKGWLQQGIDTDKDKQKWLDAIIQYPGMADLIRMMTRDVADESVVGKYKLDGVGESAFENKWTKKLQLWGEAQGVSDEVARMYWRAHWQNAAPGQIYEWLQRFRPDDRAEDDPNKELVFTEQDARDALSVADYIPGLLPFYVAASFRIPTRVDIRRFWEVGVYTDLSQVRQAYRDLGYDAKSAEFYAKFAEIDSNPKRAKRAGNLGANEVTTQYRKGLLTKNEALQLLVQAGLTNDQAIITLESSDLRKRADSRSIVVKSLQSRYNKGEFTDAQASTQLVNAFMDQQDAEDTVKLWNAQRQAKEKSATVAVLCKWYSNGQISLPDFQQRVNNLNYPAADALRIVEACQIDISKRRQAEIEKAMKQQQAEQAKANRVAAQQIKEARAAARNLQLSHLFKRKVQVKTDNVKGTTVTTTTETTTDKPDINRTDVAENVQVNGNNPPPP